MKNLVVKQEFYFIKFQKKIIFTPPFLFLVSGLKLVNGQNIGDCQIDKKENNLEK